MKEKKEQEDAKRKAETAGQGAAAMAGKRAELKEAGALNRFM